MIDFFAILWYNFGMEIDAEIAELKAENKDLKQQVQLLQEQLRLARQRQFGTSSEKSIALNGGEQLSIFNEAEAEANVLAAEPKLEQITYKRKKQKGKREMDYSGLPTEQVVHELPEKERVCPDCGGPMHACGHEVYRRELTVIPARFKVTEHLQTAYSCRKCEKAADDDPVPMLKSSVPAPVIRGSGVASPSLLAYIAHQKYVLALPLYRQEQEFKRLGLNLSRQTMANWMIYASKKYLQPIYDAMKAQLLAHQVLHADETLLQVLREPGKAPQSDSYMWLYRTSSDALRPIVLYEYQPDRCHHRPADFLGGWSGYLHTDGFEGYHKLESVTVIGCWAHLRRRYVEILKTIPKYAWAGSESLQGRQYCDQLFALEREYAKNFSSLMSPDDNFKVRHEARLKQSKPVMKKFFDWAKNSPALPQSAVGEAITYALNQRVYLEHVLLDGRLELSNNRAERSVKPFVIGRRNWMFTDTVNGANASAVLYSIVETAKENGLHPFDYLQFVFRTAPDLDICNDPNALVRLMPWNAPPNLSRAEKPSASSPWDVI